MVLKNKNLILLFLFLFFYFCAGDEVGIEEVNNSDNQTSTENVNDSKEETVSTKDKQASHQEDIDAIITTDNPYVVLNDNTVSFDYINPDEISQSNDTFSFSLLNSTPSGHTINFNISMGDWQSSFSVQAIAPLLVIENPILIDDNNDGIWDAGESAILEVNLSNYGNAAFYNYPGANLIINSPFIFETVVDNNIFFGIESQTTYIGQFFLESSPDTPDGTNIDFTIYWGYGFGCETDDCVAESILNLTRF